MAELLVVAEVTGAATDKGFVAVAVGPMGTVVLETDQIGVEELISPVDNGGEVRGGHSGNVGSH